MDSSSLVSARGAQNSALSMSCRFSNHGEFVPEAFDSISCSACFYFIFMLVKPYTEKYRTELCVDTSGVLICPIGSSEWECNCSNRSYVYNIPEYAFNKSQITPLKDLRLEPPLPFQFDMVVKDCCSAARYCCRNTLVKYNENTDATCPATWDGWNCFDWSHPGQVEKQCPNYIYGGHASGSDGLATQQCTSSGWKWHTELMREYTNYGECTPNQDAAIRIQVGVWTYSASVIAIIPAVILLMFLRPIRCQAMFILHRHLLLSCLFYGLFYILTVILFVMSDAPLSGQIYSNHMFCRFMFSIQLRYLRLTNFTWMLAEAVYLWRLLYTAQHSAEDETLRTYKFICWGTPGLITIVYSAFRSIADENGYCWIENSSVAWVEWVIIAPSLFMMIVNLLILGVVVYILFKKLSCDPHLERMNYQKAVRGALLLIPVFGVQQLLTIYRVNNILYQVLDQASNGLQGMFVALIVCYSNRSVLDCVKKYWSTHHEKRALGAECRQRMSIQENGRLLMKSPQQTEQVVL